MRIFGFELRRAKDETPPISFAPPIADDGAVVVTAGGAQGAYIDMEGTVKTEAELVTKYRNMSFNPELDTAIDDVVNEAISIEEDSPIVELVFDDLDKLGIPPQIKQIMEQEFSTILDLFDFNNKCYETFRQWYIDGRIYYNIIVDKENPVAGIQELRYLDPRKIRKIREVKQTKDKDTRLIQGSENIQQVVNEYYIYNPMGFGKNSTSTLSNPIASPVSGVKIHKDSIIHVTSGLLSADNGLVLSYLHKTIKVLNMLRSLEDASIIYRMARAPERRVFYIDKGNLPKMKAEQYIRELMTMYKNKLVYDAQTGEIRDDRKQMTILDDFWLARRGDQGTKIDTLQSGNSQGIMDEIEYFRMALYKALNIPYSRYNPENAYTIGRATEITRDEVKFSKFIDRLRLKFSAIFLKALRVQLILKGVLTPEDWDLIVPKIKFRYSRDNIWSELKESEVSRDRLQTLEMYMPFVGKYYSNEFIMKNVLKLTEEEIEEMQQQIMQELNNPLLFPEQNLMNPEQPVIAGGGSGPTNQSKPKKKKKK